MSETPIEQLGPQVAAWLGGYNPVDLVLIAFLGLYGLNGIRRGFIATTLGLLAIFVAFLVALRFYAPAGAMIAEALQMPPALAGVLGFAATLVVAQIVTAIAVRLLLLAIAPVRLILAPLAVLDHALGFVPGVVHAAIIATIVITPLQAFPLLPRVTEAIAGSALAQEIPRRVASVAPDLRALIDGDAGSVVAPFGVLGAPATPGAAPAGT